LGFRQQQDDYHNYGLKKSRLKTWNLMDEAIYYCTTDCISLFKVIQKFNKLLFDNIKININDNTTLPSHGFRIYRTHFMTENKIPMIFGYDYDLLKLAFTGVAAVAATVDMLRSQPN
jgi:hypothetical protein